MAVMGAYIPVHDKSTDPNVVLYQSMVNLWKHRDLHKVFLVTVSLPGVRIGLPALKNYCIEKEKTLILDTHFHVPGCNKEPTIVPVINKEVCDPNNLIEKYEEKCVFLEPYMYNSLFNMSKMGLAALYHEDIPLHYNNKKERLESIYEDIYFLPVNTGET